MKLISLVLAALLCGSVNASADSCKSFKIVGDSTKTLNPGPNTSHNGDNGSGSGGLADGNIKKVEVNGHHSVTLHPGEKFSLKVGINNKGDSVYEDAQVYVYLTDDKGADLRGDKPLKKDKNEVSDLDPDERKTVHLSGLKAPSKPGTYYIYAWIKSQKDTADSNYDNDYSNTGDTEEYAKITVVPRPKPDFLLEDFDAAVMFEEGENPKVRYVIKNNGTGASGQVCESIRVFPKQGNNLLYHGNFCHSASDTGKVVRTLTRSFGPGVYRFEARADASGKFAESNEGNNLSTKLFKVFAKPKPDIVPIRILFTKRAVEGKQTQIKYNLRNDGKATVKGYVCDRIDVIKDGKFVKYFDNCHRENTFEPTHGREKTFDFIAPNEPGIYQLSIKTDFWNAIKESNEGNNRKVIDFKVFSKPKPDIVVTKIWFSKAALATQQTQAKYNVRNNSGVPVNGYICDRVDVIKNGGYINYFDNCYSVHIQPYQKVEKVVNFTSPNTAGGGYKLSVKADFYNAIKEANDWNNQRVIDFAVFAKPVASYRYYHDKLHTHLFTSNYSVPNGWRYADRSFKVFRTQIPGTVPIYAAWNWRDRTHRYSRSKSDLRHYFSEEPWVAFYAYPSWRPGTKPVRELWHPSLRVYIYSNGEGDANKLHDRFGFQKKNIMWYSPN